MRHLSASRYARLLAGVKLVLHLVSTFVMIGAWLRHTMISFAAAPYSQIDALQAVMHLTDMKG